MNIKFFKIGITFLSLLFYYASFSQTTAKINWVSFEEAVSNAQKDKKPIFLDMYTDWCGWCKKMDEATFSDPKIAEYINKNYHAVKFNAETTQSITYKDSVYTNNNIGKLDENGRPSRRKSHSLAEVLMQGRMSYPTIVYMVVDKDFIAPVPGYQTPDKIEPILLYFGEKVYEMNLFEAFSKGMNVEKIVK